MTQTLFMGIKNSVNALNDLSESFPVTIVPSGSQHTSDSYLQTYTGSDFSEIESEDILVKQELRGHFLQAAILLAKETEESTIDEWPEALEFKDWATIDCVEFCNSHGLLSDLRRCRAALDAIFSNIQRSSAELDYYQDTDSEDEGHIVIRIEIASDRETYRKEYNSWIKWMVENISDDSRLFITVSIDRL